MVRRISLLVHGFFLVVFLTASTAGAQYGGYGGRYSSPPPPAPEPTETPSPEGVLSLSLSFIGEDGIRRGFPATLHPGQDIQIEAILSASGYAPGDYSLAAMVLDSAGGQLRPSRHSMSGSGSWTLHFRASRSLGSYPVLFFARDRLQNHRSASSTIKIQIVEGHPLLMSGGIPLSPRKNTAELRIANRSWLELIRLRQFTSPNWFEHFQEDLDGSYGWKDTISRAVKIDRDRLNVLGRVPPREEFGNYLDIEPIMGKYWSDGGIALSTLTANQIGNVVVTWRSTPGLFIKMNSGVCRTLGLSGGSINIGRVLNYAGGAMILLDFWSNIATAESPVEAREAWYKAGYASLDLYLAGVIAETFGAAAALPGLWTSYILGNSYNTLIGGYKECWYKRMLIEAVDADFLSEDLNDQVAVDRVKRAMLSRGGLKNTLMNWWAREAPTWAGKMGGCGNWDLAEARGYRKVFVDRIMKTHEVEIDGKVYHPWTFYYGVSRMLALERKKELAAQAAENVRKIEGAYISFLAEKKYEASFRLIGSDSMRLPIRNARLCLSEDTSGENCSGGWKTDHDGNVTLRIQGHRFSPKQTVLLQAETGGGRYLFLVPQTVFRELQP